MAVLRSLSHWGAFRAEVADGRLVRVAPFEHDPEPSDLISVWPEMVTSPLRVATPSVRRGWLARDGGAMRGDDTFIEIGWDEALDMAAGEDRPRVPRFRQRLPVFGLLWLVERRPPAPCADTRAALLQFDRRLHRPGD
jgi:biotin/methionine sulfoxide reductase